MPHLLLPIIHQFYIRAYGGLTPRTQIRWSQGDSFLVTALLIVYVPCCSLEAPEWQDHICLVVAVDRPWNQACANSPRSNTH